MSHAAKIRELNDQYRKHGLGCGRLLATGSVAHFGADFLLAAWLKVREYDRFTEENDPHGEHDFGSFELQGQTLFWKIDYYDRSLKNGSEDPSDPMQTTRVLTLMLASDY